jgi:PEP-CTERM motif
LHRPSQFAAFARIAAAASLTCAAFSAQAAVHSFQAVTTGGTVIAFSYDDTAAGGQPDPFAGSHPGWYPLLSFSVNSVPAAGILIGLYDDFLNGRDYLYVGGPTATDPYLQLEDADANVFTSLALGQVNGLTLASFNASPGGNIWSVGNEELVSFAPAAPIPEPSTWALGLLGLGAMAAWMRRPAR